MAEEKVEVVEDSRRVSKDGTVTVRGHWVVTQRGTSHYRKGHSRRRRR